jgi:hypothetical protein
MYNLTFFFNENFMHILPTLGATNFKPSEYKKSTKWKKRNHFPCCPFRMDFVAFKILILFNQMHYMNIAKHKCMHYLFMKEN